MSKEQLLIDLYELHTQMITDNGFNFDWGRCESWENGAFISGVIPQFHIKFGEETNDDRSNGLGTNEYQNLLPMTVRFGATMTDPSEDMKTVDSEITIFEAKMLRDIKRAFGNPYKINIANFYCGTEYNGESDEDDENENNDPYTVIGGADFTITYTEDRGINGW